MKEYKVKGLSCPDCTLRLQSEIRKLEYGENAELSYTKSKLHVHHDINMEKVKEILSKDNVIVVTDEHEGHDHHLHGEIAKLAIAAILFVTALFIQNPYVAIPLYLSAMLISGYQVFLKGFRNLLKFNFTIDTLMTIALVGAVAIGEWKEGTLVALLFGLNEYLEGLGMDKARRSMEKLLDLAPKTATVITDGAVKVVPVEQLEEEEIVLIKAGETIPSDGVIVEGTSYVNEAAVTGESLPVEKKVGDRLFGGSVNLEATLKVKITKKYSDSSLARILHLVEQAQETKTPTELFINRFSKYYTPFIIVFAIIVTIVPPLFLNSDWLQSLYQGLAVLIVGCPCALILSSPIANISGITRNARNGILVKGSIFLELLGKINTIVFDKTGTLTKGVPHVEKEIVYDRKQFYNVASAIEKHSSHPLAKAVLEKAEPFVTEELEAANVTTIAGQGLKAEINGVIYWIGNEKHLSHLTLPNDVKNDIQTLKEEGLTLVIVSNETDVLGIFGLSDEVRAESKRFISALRKAGIQETVMLTGDHEQTARKVAGQLGISTVYSNLLPEEKVEKLQRLMDEGKVVAMVGDGINDAPALAAADVGIAMGKGTDSAIETADVVLMQDHLSKLPDAIQIAKRVNRLIKFNISIALGLKAIALLLTIPGWLTLWFAILSDMGATVIVTILSLTILLEKDKWKKAGTIVHE